MTWDKFKDYFIITYKQNHLEKCTKNIFSLNEHVKSYWSWANYLVYFRL